MGTDRFALHPAINPGLTDVDPGFCLAYRAHLMRFVNNFCRNANEDQWRRYLDKVMSGSCRADSICSQRLDPNQDRFCPWVGPRLLGLRSRTRPEGDEINRSRPRHRPNNSLQARNSHQPLMPLTTRRSGDIASVSEKGGLNLLFLPHSGLHLFCFPTLDCQSSGAGVDGCESFTGPQLSIFRSTVSRPPRRSKSTDLFLSGASIKTDFSE